MDTQKCLDAFLNQLEYDRGFMEDLMSRYYFKVRTCGEYLLKKQVYYSYTVPPGIRGKDEFLEFIDGNGFKVVKHGGYNLYRIYPQYKTEVR